MTNRLTLAVCLASASLSAQTNVPAPGNWKFIGSMEPPTTTFAALPSAATNTNRVQVVTDGNTDCTGGSGTKKCWFRSNGTIWESLGGDGGGTGGAGDLTSAQLQSNSRLFVADTAGGATDAYTGCPLPPLVASVVNITQITDSGSTATAVTSATHDLVTGDRIAILGVTGDTDLNGGYTVTRINALSFSYTSALVTDAVYNNAGITGTTTYKTGQGIWFKPAFTNVGAATMDLCGLGQRGVNSDSDSTLPDGTMVSGYLYWLWYDADTWRVTWSSQIPPSPANNEGKLVTTPDGVSQAYESRLAMPPALQSYAVNNPLILPLSSNVHLTPDAARTLCTATGLISDGAYAGQWLTLHNRTAFPQVIRDKANCTGNKIDNGGADAYLGANGSVNYQWVLPNWVLRDRQVLGAITLAFDGGGSAIAAGLTTAPLASAFSCKILNWTVAADVAGSIAIDIWKSTTIPSVANTITASAKPSLSSSTLIKDQPATGWITAVSAGDVIVGKVDSATTLTKATVTIPCLR